MRLLVVEDDPLVADGLTDLLRAAGHAPTHERDGLAAVERGTAESFDLVLLDLSLPDLDGLEVCRRLRRVRPTLPVIALTSRAHEDEIVRGLKAGADDYVTKPFAARELLARIDAVARRAAALSGETEVLEIENLTLRLDRCEAVIDGEPTSLTPREVGMLRLLHQHRERAVSRPEFLQQVWGLPGHLSTRTVDMAIANLRRKIEPDPAKPRIILSVKGVGYAWGPE